MHMKLSYLLFKTGVDFDVNSISALVSYHIVDLFPVANIALNYIIRLLICHLILKVDAV